MRNIIRWEDPFSGLSSLHSHIDDMFNDLLASGPTTASGTRLPAMDVYSEGDKQMVVEVAAPGFNKEDIDISVHNGVLELKADKQEKEEDKDEDRTYMIRESNISFYRRVALPKHADADNIDAEFDNGVLRVTIPYKELPQPKKVQISGRSKEDKKKK